MVALVVFFVTKTITIKKKKKKKKKKEVIALLYNIKPIAVDQQ